MSRDAEQSPLPGELPLKEAIDWSQSRAPALALDLARQLAELMQRLSQQRVSLAMELADLRVSQGRLYFDTRGRSALAGLDAELHYLTSFRRLMSALLEPLSRCSQAPLLWILTRRYGSLAELLEALEQARVAGPASESQLSCEALSDFAIPEPPSAPSLLALLRLPPRLALGLTALAMLSSAIAAWWLLRPTGLPEHCLVLRGDGEILVLDTQSERSLSRWPLDNRVIAISWSQHPWVAVVEPDGLAVELLDGRTGKAAGRLRLPTSGSPVTHIVGLSEGLVAVAPGTAVIVEAWPALRGGKAFPVGPSCQALLASDKRLYLAGSDTLFVYDLESGRQLAERGLPGIADLAFAQGGLAVACPGRLLLLDANTLMQSREIRLEDDARRLLATPAGLVVMTGSGGLLRLRPGGARDALPVPPEGIRDLAARGEDIWMIGRTGALYRAGSADSSPRKIRLRRPVRAF